MAWPTPQDYNEAVQNPKLAFADSELQVGRPELTDLGLPRPITGGFASVYKLQCPQRTWAVRCFLRQFDDHERRYAAISEHLSRLRLPYTVGFTFLRNGIRVRGQWYPILKMEWVQGEPLTAFIERHLGDRSTLLSLAKHWVEMVTVLQQASIAHGDLQHGNVLVVDGQLRLIDYDGMYVPALSGESSHEVGHRNYQHPLRTESDFGAYLDNFSAWIVYVSLIVLAANPGLWPQFGAGDESLLFRRTDFEQPEASDVLHTLERHPDEQIRSAIALFQPVLYLQPRDVPSLDAHLTQPASVAITCEGCGQALRVPAHRGPCRVICPSCGWQIDWPPTPPDLSDWLKDHLGTEPGPKEEPANDDLPAPRQHPEPDPSWIIDGLAPCGPSLSRLTFANSVAVERLFLGLSTIGALLLVRAAQLAVLAVSTTLLGILLVLVALANVALWVYRYYSEQGVVHHNDLKARLRSIAEQIRANGRSIEVMEEEKGTISERFAAEEARLATEQKSADAKEKEEIDRRRVALQSALSSIDARRRALNQQQADALRRLNNSTGTRVATIDRQIADLNQAEATEHSRTLQARQQEHIKAYLRRASIRNAHIPGYPPGDLVFRLERAGYRTAADVDRSVQGVTGIGPKRTAALIQWRQRMESRARRTAPSALSPSEAAAIRARYNGQRRGLEQQRDSEVQRQRREEDNLRALHRRLLEQLDHDQKAAKARTQMAISEVSARYAQQCHAIRETLSKLSDDTASRLRVADATIAEVRNTLFSLHWQQEKLTRQLEPYEGLRFSNYVKRVFFGSKAA